MAATAIEASEQERADALLRTAQEAGYRFPEGFGGFTAKLAVGDAVIEVTARDPKDVTFQADKESDDPELVKWARREIASIVGHRWPKAYADGDGRYRKRLDADRTNPAGQLVHFEDDPFCSSYRVQDGHLTEVRRTAHGTRFTIVIGSRVAVGDQHLPGAFSVYYWPVTEAGDTEELAKVETYSDEYVEVDGVWLPAARRITTGDKDGLTTRHFRLTDHALLES